MSLALTKVDKTILGLAVSALGSLAIDPLLTLADTAFIARLGTTQLAALGVDTAIVGTLRSGSKDRTSGPPILSRGRRGASRRSLRGRPPERGGRHRPPGGIRPTG